MLFGSYLLVVTGSRLTIAVFNRNELLVENLFAISLLDYRLQLHNILAVVACRLLQARVKMTKYWQQQMKQLLQL